MPTSQLSLQTLNLVFVISLLTACQTATNLTPNLQPSDNPSSPAVSPDPAASSNPGGSSTPGNNSGNNSGSVTNNAGAPIYQVVGSNQQLPDLPLTASGNGASLSLKSAFVKPGKKLSVSFTAPTGLPTNAWIGMVPSEVAHGQESVNNQQDIGQQYLDGKTSGTLEFVVPTAEKRLDFRLNSPDGRELTSISFMVTPELSQAELQAASLSLPRRQYKPGQTIRLGFKAPASFEPSAWVGLVPSHVAHGSERINDQNKVNSKPLAGQTSGEMDYLLFNEDGNYDFRIHDRDDDGKEAGYLSIVISRDLLPEEISNSELTLNKTTFKPGERITLTFKAPQSFDPDAWIGIVPERIAHGEEPLNEQNRLAYQVINGRLNGILEFNAPEQTGDYSFRLHDRDTQGKEAKSASFKVEP